jgi:hypothetical protein
MVEQTSSYHERQEAKRRTGSAQEQDSLRTCPQSSTYSS